MSAPTNDTRPAFEPVPGRPGWVTIAQLPELVVYGARDQGRPGDVAYPVAAVAQLPGSRQPYSDAEVGELVARLLAWLWNAHNQDTLRLAHQVVARLVQWRDGQLGAVEAMELWKALGMVRTVNPGGGLTP